MFIITGTNEFDHIGVASFVAFVADEFSGGVINELVNKCTKFEYAEIFEYAEKMVPINPIMEEYWDYVEGEVLRLNRVWATKKRKRKSKKIEEVKPLEPAAVPSSPDDAIPIVSPSSVGSPDSVTSPDSGASPSMASPDAVTSPDVIASPDAVASPDAAASPPTIEQDVLRASTVTPRATTSTETPRSTVSSATSNESVSRATVSTETPRDDQPMKNSKARGSDASSDSTVLTQLPDSPQPPGYVASPDPAVVPKVRHRSVSKKNSSKDKDRS